MLIELLDFVSGMVGLMVFAPLFAVALTMFGFHLYMEWHYFLAWRKRMASPPVEAPVATSAES